MHKRAADPDYCMEFNHTCNQEEADVRRETMTTFWLVCGLTMDLEILAQSQPPGPGATTLVRHQGGYPGGSCLRGGERGDIVEVISDPGVRAELDLTAGQQERISGIVTRVRAQEREIFEEARNGCHEHSQPPSQCEADFFPMRSGSSTPICEWIEQRCAKLNAMRAAIAQAGQEVRGCLTAMQRKRLREICLQVQGAEALFKPNVLQTLDLTPAQVERLRAFNQETERQTMALRGPVSGSSIAPSSVAQQIATLKCRRQKQMIRDVLDATQQALLHQLEGEPFAGAALLELATAGHCCESHFSCAADP